MNGRHFCWVGEGAFRPCWNVNASPYGITTPLLLLSGSSLTSIPLQHIGIFYLLLLIQSPPLCQTILLNNLSFTFLAVLLAPHSFRGHPVGQFSWPTRVSSE